MEETHDRNGIVDARTHNAVSEAKSVVDALDLVRHRLRRMTVAVGVLTLFVGVLTMFVMLLAVILFGDLVDHYGYDAVMTGAGLLLAMAIGFAFGFVFCLLVRYVFGGREGGKRGQPPNE